MPHTLTLSLDHFIADISSNFQGLYCREDFIIKMDEINRAAQHNHRLLPNLARELLSMLKACRCENAEEVCASIINAHKENVIGSLLYQRIPENILPQTETIEKAFSELIAIYRYYPTPEYYMRRLVNRLEMDESLRPGQTGSVRLAILRHFLFCTDYEFLSAARYIISLHQEEFDKISPARPSKDFKRKFIRERLDDSVFDALGFPAEDGSGDAVPPGAPALFTLAHNLATGRFNTQGGTRRQLYLFALAYGMTADLLSPDSRNEDTDITKNLFEDYYNNNLLSNLAARHRTNGIETMPSGAGINLKNFVEVVYIYCLKRTDLDAAGKIKLANKIIYECTHRTTKPSGGSLDSIFFRREAEKTINELLSQSFDDEKACIDAVADRICAIYDTSADNINIRSQQERAFQQYSDLIASIRNDLDSQDISGIIIRPDAHDGLFYERETFLFSLSSADISEEEYEQISFAFHRFLEILSDPDLFDLTDSSKLSRFRVIAVFYYYFKYVLNGAGGYTPLPEVFDIFVSELNPILDACGYQRLSSKNLFDMFIIFHAYLNADTTEHLVALNRHIVE